MKALKSTLSIVLILSMLLSFIACSGGNQNDVNVPSETTAKPAETTEPPIFYEADELPEDLDFEGTTISILSPDGGNLSTDITVEDLNSDVVNDSIYNRELFVEDRLGIEIENHISATTGDQIKKQATSGDDTYQIWADKTYGFSAFTFDSYFLDLTEIEYIDLEKPWWSENFIKEASIGESLYFATGSITLSLLRNLFAVYFNKDLAADYVHQDEFADLENIYDIVESGKWTFDKFYALSSSLYEDLNGNSEKDAEDKYGLGLHSYSLDTVWSSFDLNVLSPTSDGWFEIDINTDKLYNAFEKLCDLVHQSKGCLFSSVIDEAAPSLTSAFANGTVLFAVDYLSSVESGAIRNMTSEYGLIPFPKYDENQKDYYSYPYDEYMSFAIPFTNSSPEIAGAVLEALASYSYRETIPAYLNLALKGKYMNDPQSRTMVDYIVNGFTLDTSWIYIFTIGSSYPAGYRNNVDENDRTFASAHARRVKSLTTALKAYKSTIPD